MNITTKNYQNLFLATSLLLSLCCGAFLFDSTDNLLKKLLILFFVASLLSNRPTLCNLSSFKDFIAPWLPWCLLFVGVGYISHGSKGLAYFFQLCILLTLFGITFSKVYFSRLVVVRGLALNIIFISVPIVLYVLIYGVKTEFLGNNKNILIAGLTLMSVIVVTYFLQMRKSCSSFDKFLITVACACSSVAIVLSEVRLAMLGIFGALFVLLIWSKKIFSFKALGLFALVMLFFCLGFMATGRLQQGYHDLIMW